MEKIHPFLPVYNEESLYLILGSMPSIASFKLGFYYMHPQNRFWKMLSQIFNEDAYNMTIPEKKDFILRHHLALYDIIYSCSITNSSDASIKDPICTRIDEIIKNMPNLQSILLNGKKAYEIFIKEYPQLESIAICLPSTSSANAAIMLDELVSKWKRALQLGG